MVSAVVLKVSKPGLGHLVRKWEVIGLTLYYGSSETFLMLTFLASSLDKVLRLLCEEDNILRIKQSSENKVIPKVIAILLHFSFKDKCM